MNIKSQYALAFCIYLVKAGHVSTLVAAKQLEISQSLLSQVAWKLRVAGILAVRKGPGGGYWFKSGVVPTVGQVLEAMDEAWVGASLTGVMAIAANINGALTGVYERSIKDFAEMSNSIQTQVGTVDWSK